MKVFVRPVLSPSPALLAICTCSPLLRPVTYHGEEQIEDPCYAIYAELALTDTAEECCICQEAYLGNCECQRYRQSEAKNILISG